MATVNRPYQVTAILNAEKGFETFQSVMEVLPTGCGKSRIFSELVRRVQPKRSLVLAHRSELVWQAAKNVNHAGLDTSIEKADSYADVNLFNRSPVVVASVQTMVSGRGEKKRMHRWRPTDFGLIVCDECHHFTAPMFKRVLDYFREGNPGIKIFGCTASPKRADEQALGLVFQECVFKYQIADAIKDGWLVPIKAIGLEVEDMDFSGIKTSDGDLNTAELAAIMEREKPLYGVAAAALEAAFYMEPNALHGVPREQWYDFLMDHQTPPRSTLCFAVDVQHASMLAQIFNRVVPNIANFVCGKTNPKDREDMLADFRNGGLPILTNCGVMTEGVDVPRAEVIVPKPTKSHALAIQMYGRGLRPPEVDGKSIVDQYGTPDERRSAISRSRKPCCTILDLYGVTGRHKMVTSPDVLGGDYSEEVIEMTKEAQKTSARPMDISEALAASKEKLRKEQELARQAEAARKQRIIVPTKFAVSKADPLDTHDVTQVKMYKPKLMADCLSPKQQWILTNKLGKDPARTPLGWAKKLIGDHFTSLAR
jgi:superfamily II DNA or RNA helicase